MVLWIICGDIFATLVTICGLSFVGSGFQELVASFSAMQVFSRAFRVPDFVNVP